MFKVPEQCRSAEDEMKWFGCRGNDENGCFLIMLPTGRTAYTIVSRDLGWEHVSVSIRVNVGMMHPLPSWEEMCYVKDQFWDKDDWAAQYHPAEKEYVNHHPFCLHLFRPMDGIMPTPPSILIGPDSSKKGKDK